jgi:hypothetical protein
MLQTIPVMWGMLCETSDSTLWRLRTELDTRFFRASPLFHSCWAVSGHNAFFNMQVMACNATGGIISFQ